MKLFYTLFLLCALVCATIVSAQVAPGAAPKQMTDRELGEFYLKKSKGQKTTGWALLGGGMVMYVVGISVAVNDDSGTGAVAALLGSFATVASIPFFISSARNKGRAEVLLRHENIPLGFIPHAPRSMPAIGIRFNLTR